MEKKKRKKVKLRHKLISKYRLIILNEESFEEKISFKLTRLNVFIWGGLFSIILVIATIFLIAFTPLKEYIPGYSSIQLKRDATNLVYKVDSLEQILEVNNVYIEKIRENQQGFRRNQR